MAGHGDKEQLLKNDSEEVTPTVQLSPGNRRLRSLSGESYGGRQSTEKPIFSFENVETGHTVTVKQDSPVDSYHSSHASLASAVRRSSNLSVGVHDMLAVPSPQVTVTRRESNASISSSGMSAASLWKRKSLHPTISIDSLSSPAAIDQPAGRRGWKQMSKLARSRSVTSASSAKSLASIIGSEKSELVYERIRNLVNAFSERAWRIKERVAQPPTPSESEEEDEDVDVDKEAEPQRQRLDSFLEGDSTSVVDEPLYITVRGRKIKLPRFMKFPRKHAIDPQGRLYLLWLFLVTCCYTYNAWSIFLRAAFSHHQTAGNLKYWLTFDYLSDLVYLLDILLIKMHIVYLDEGIFIDDRKMMMKNYLGKIDFKLDVASLVPLDIFYFVTGVKPMLRFPRLLKVQTFWECYTRLDAIAKAPHFVRVFKTCTYMLFMIHIQSCAFYAFSEFEKSKGIYNEWVYNDQGNAYIRCFYFATKTATSIGNNPTPQNINEFMYMTLAWLMGVFVFALLIGQVRDIFQASRMMKTEYRKTMDITTNYMQNLKVPNELQDRVKLWFNYNWEQQKTLNENAALDILPLKMRTDLAINVHYQTLIKVQLFQDCEKGLLRALVLKLKPVLFLPGDSVCRKGDVGHEMYIVNNGQVQVMGGEKNDIVLATLHSGSVFGEISLLSLAGGNRRTADVRSRGFSNLFILSKNDLQEAIKDYPDAQDALKRRAKKIMAQNAKRERKPSLEEEVEVKPGTHNTPRMVSAVIQAMDKNPEIHFREVTQILTGRKSRTSSTLPPQLSMDRQSSVEQHPSPDGSNTGGTDELLVVETTQQGSKQSTQISIRQSLNQETAERRSRLSKMRSINENVDDKTGACEEQHADSAIENTTSPNSSLDEAEQNAGGYMDVKIKNTLVPENDPNGPGSQESGISVDELHEKGTRKDRRSGKERLGIKTRVAPLTKREQGKDDWDASVDSSSELGATEESQPSSATMSALQQQMWQKRASLFQAKSSLEEPIVTENTASPYQKVASENKNEAGKGENFSNPTSQQGRIVSPPPNHGRGDVSVLTSKPARKSSPSASQKAGDVSVPTSQQARKFSPPNSQSGGDASVSAVQQGQRVSHPTSQNGGEVSSPASRQVRKVSPSAQGEAVSATPRPVQRQPTYELPLPCHSELILTPKSLMSLDREASVLSRSLSMQDRAVSTSSSLMSASFDFEDESNIALHPADGHQGGHMSPDRLSKCSSCSGGLDNLGYLPESDSSETVHINETSC